MRSIILALSFLGIAFAQMPRGLEIPLWPEGAPGAENLPDVSQPSDDPALPKKFTVVHHPSIYVFLAPNDKANAPRRPKPQRFPRTRISPPKTVYFRPRKLYNTQDDLGLRMPNSDELLSLAGFGWRENHISALFSGSAGRDQWGIDVPEVAVAL